VSALLISSPWIRLSLAFVPPRFGIRIKEPPWTPPKDFGTDVIQRVRVKIRSPGFLPVHRPDSITVAGPGAAASEDGKEREEAGEGAIGMAHG